MLFIIMHNIHFIQCNFFPVPSGKINRDRELENLKNRDRDRDRDRDREWKKPGIPGPGPGPEVYNPSTK